MLFRYLGNKEEKVRKARKYLTYSSKKESEVNLTLDARKMQTLQLFVFALFFSFFHRRVTEKEVNYKRESIFQTFNCKIYISFPRI